MEAGYARIGQCTLEVVFYDLFYGSAAPSDYLDAMVCKFFLCSVSHVPCKHKTYAHLLQRSGDVAFAATPLGEGSVVEALISRSSMLKIV